MKAAYYYSKKQKLAIKQAESIFIDGKEFTEAITNLEDSDEVPAQNNWSDSILIHVEESLPLDTLFLEEFGYRFADIKEVCHKISVKAL